MSKELSQIYDFCHEIEESLKERFEQFDKTAEYNQMKVLLAMQKNRVSEECFGSSSGYGYNDYGRDTLEKVYADTFHTEAYEIARRNNIEIIDATCPVVLRLQKKIKQEYTQKDTEDKQIVIYGKTGHAEVLGLVGQTTGEAIVIEKLEEAKKLDFTRSIRLYSQTTNYGKK